MGAHFGVVVVRAGPDHVEVATFRTDGSYRDGRRPEEVTFSTPEEDAQRRDFTVNGLFQDPATDEVIDFVGGQADLAAKVLRAIGNPGGALPRGSPAPDARGAVCHDPRVGNRARHLGGRQSGSPSPGQNQHRAHPR